MKLIWNWFSGKTYYETADSIIDEDGSVFSKTVFGYVGEDGTEIQRVGNNLLNTTTGDWSVNTDVFACKNDY